MPRAAAVLPESVEIHPNDPKKARCRTCFAMDPHGAGKWMARSSMKTHLKSSTTHLQNIREEQEKRKREAQIDVARAEIYSGNPASTSMNSFSIPEPTVHPSVSYPAELSGHDFDDIYGDFLEPIAAH
ncbi:hypothetical protein K435DRAFT_811487 [Dendrothele bispora CBS 962.96]|uniref:Uncharacterized protein n=1 Tax=Dendrothele bispora (strain CBS 962.96) TaxID=1314807 RepID=A0A4V4HB96_DENBC|nr:hypothetical protein K435DRAFT_811487 [Dendrothele bispora CBS 962.96]